MKEYTSSQLLSLLAVPGAMVFLGLVLLLAPALAPALAGALIGIFFILAGLGLGAGIFFGSSAGRISRGLWALVFLIIGLRLLISPLSIARFLGRVLGILLILQGARSTAEQTRCRRKSKDISWSLVLGVVTVVAGAVLVCLPLISTRIFFRIVGILLVCLGTAKGADNLLGRKPEGRGGGPRIIDVEKL